MKKVFDFGPENEINIRLVDGAESIYGSYDSLPTNIQEALQLILHAMLQVSKDVLNSPGGMLFIETNFMIIGLEGRDNINRYTLINMNNEKGVINLLQDRNIQGSYCTDFFFINQLFLCKPVFDFAYQDSLNKGRRY